MVVERVSVKDVIEIRESIEFLRKNMEVIKQAFPKDTTFLNLLSNAVPHLYQVSNLLLELDVRIKEP